MNFMHFQMLEITGDGEQQQVVERSIAIAKDKIEGVAEVGPERCVIFTSGRQVIVKAVYLEIVGALNNNG